MCAYPSYEYFLKWCIIAFYLMLTKMQISKLLPFIGLILSFNLHAEITKGTIDNSYVQFKTDLINRLKKQASECLSRGNPLLWKMDDAHQSFMADNIPRAIIRALDAVELGADLTKQYHHCSYSYVTEHNQADFYMEYYLSIKQIPKSNEEPSLPISDHYKERISVLFEMAYNKILSVCRTNTCSYNKREALEISKSIYNEINKKNPSNKKLLEQLSLLRYFLGQCENEGDANTWREALSWITEKTNYSLSILEEYVFSKTNPTITQKYQLQIIKYMQAEKSSQHKCSLLLARYNLALNVFPTENKYNDLQNMIVANGKLFNILYQYGDSRCHLQSTLEQIPFNFYKEIGKEIANTTF